MTDQITPEELAQPEDEAAEAIAGEEEISEQATDVRTRVAAGDAVDRDETEASIEATALVADETEDAPGPTDIPAPGDEISDDEPEGDGEDEDEDTDAEPTPASL